MTPENLTVMFLSMAILLGAARALGDIAQRFHQPAVVGELLAGVLLGPTIFGNFAPAASAFLFPMQGPNAIALDAIANLAVVLFMLVAGMEVDLSTIWRQGRTGLKVGIASMVIPFALGFSAAWFAPAAMGRHAGADTLLFALFLATALSITALPVIAKTLIDMDLYRSDFGMVVISAAIINDLWGWIVFAVILGMMGAANGHENHIGMTIAATLAFAAAMLTAGRWLIHKSLPFLQAYTKWPGGVLGFALTLAMLGAAFTEWIGIHAIFGSFLVGVAIGDSSHLRERTRVTIDHFVSSIFAPLFFASIGLRVNFISHFDALLALTVLAIACASKLAGGTIGARWGGMSARDSWAVGFAMNSRGAMEIILGLLALNAGLIRQRLFVALVIVALVTSMMSGPAMRCILRSIRKRRLHDFLSPKLFLRELQAGSPRAAIRELAERACDAAGLNVEAVDAAVWAREEAMSTGIGNGVAMPHARVDNLTSPVVAVGISQAGIDFDAPDDKLANVIFLVLSPSGSAGAHLEIASEIARLFHDPHLLDQTLRLNKYTDFLALIKNAIVEKDLQHTQ